MRFKLDDIKVLQNLIFTFPMFRTVKQKIINLEAKEIEIKVIDPRNRSADQVKKARVLCKEISLWSGDVPEYIYDVLKYDFCTYYSENHFTMSSCSMDLASNFITFLVDFCLVNNVPIKKPLVDYSDDVYKYFYSCIENKVCSICGNPTSDLHHVDTVGIGFNRNITSHGEKQAIQLCRLHHTESHNIGVKTFKERYNVDYVRLDRYLCSVAKLKY